MPTGDDDPEVAFGVLGPLIVTLDGVPVVLGAAKTRILLGSLLLRRGGVVPMDELVDRLWDNEPPAGARNAVHTYVRRLRGALGPAGRMIKTELAGYLIEAPASAVDLDRFRQHVARARAAAGDPAGEARELRAALALWRGQPLSDVRSDALHRNEVTHLVEERLQAVERRVDLDLAAGRSAELVAELRSLIAEYPLREHLWRQLMLALYRGNRQAEALAAFRDVSDVLREELGIGPCTELTELHQQILAGGPVPGGRQSPPADSWIPAFQLPAEVVGFVGRSDLVDRVARLLTTPGPAGTGVAMVTLSGPPGIGKTELAVHVAHQLRDRFPDGQLFVNLRGYSPNPPMRPVEALPRFLRAIGVGPERIPLDPDEQSALFRSALAQRRVLLVLDNAAGPDQVRPLLPGNATCAVIVTSRDSLHGLSAVNGAHRVPVDAVTPAEAEVLLSAILGPQRAATEPVALRELAAACGMLPLALRIAASHLAATPDQKIAAYVHQLRADDRISALSIEGDHQAAVRLAFDLSYDALKPEPARLFRVLSLVPGADFDGYAAANLAGLGPGEAQRVLGALVTANLVQPHGPGRFQFHDLIREYARGKAFSHDGVAECAAAGRRLFDFYLHSADAAGRLLYPDQPRLAKPDPGPLVRSPGWDSPREALDWLNAEAANMVAAAHEDNPGWPSVPVWLLVDALLGYVVRQRLDAVWVTVFTAAVTAAGTAGERAAEAALRRGLGRLLFQRGQYHESRDCYLDSLALCRSLHDGAGAGRNLIGLGAVAFEMQEYVESARHFEDALALLRVNGDRAGQATTLINLGTTLIIGGRLADGVARLTESGTLAAELGLRHLRSRAAANTALAHCWGGELERAAEELAWPLDWMVELGYVEGRSEALRILAEVHLGAGRTGAAVAAAGQALDLAEQVGSRWTEVGARVILSQALLADGRVDQAWGQLVAARELTVPGSGYWYPHVLLNLATCHRARGELAEAADLARGLLD
ncbi:MAG TPA: BTAD domain-containing putative transcriptional regulator, partial [Rugosimonospora sp.]|nr:BTAD domain-containing putative transcriptional regulator [Rugosimonospora sp.]